MKKITKILLLASSIGMLSILLTVLLLGKLYSTSDRWSFGRDLGHRGGMMNEGRSGWRLSSPAGVSESYSLDSVNTVVEAYLQNRNMSDEFYIAEIMIFDNHAYVQLNEVITGIGAMELLVDADTFNIYPEQGPNMMWNQKYGAMRGMMNDFRTFDWNGDPTQMPVSEEQAVQIAQEYLIRTGGNWQVEDHAEIFFGYYTLHVVDGDDATIGMLSVNGFDGDVFYHSWHGEFIEMSEVANSNKSH